jgi:hypothetical protein
MAFPSAPSFFSSPSFGVDTSGAFSSTAKSLSSSPFSSSFKPTGTSMAAIDPFSAVLGIGSIATSIGGLFGQKSAAEKQAEAVKDAAEAQAKAVKQASKTGAELQLAEFGLNFLKDRYEGGAGGALDRVNAARDLVQRANIEANNPSYMALRSVARYEDRLRNAMPGYTPPSALFS